MWEICQTKNQPQHTKFLTDVTSIDPKVHRQDFLYEPPKPVWTCSGFPTFLIPLESVAATEKNKLKNEVSLEI